MAIRNLTPHPLTLYRTDDGEPVTIPPELPTPRVSLEETQIGVVSLGPLGDVDLTRATYGVVTDLPGYQEGVILVVSRLVRDALPARTDLACPARLVRDEAGRVIGARALERS